MPIRLAVCLLSLLLHACGGSVPEAQAQPRKLIAVIGDSITAGMMPVSGYVQVRQDLAWTAELWAAGATVVTAAVGGQTTVDAAGLQVARLRGLPATHVVVMTGVNDAVRGVPLAESARALNTILDAFPGAVPVLVAPPLWDEGTRAAQTAWRDYLATTAVIRGGAFIDASKDKPSWRCHPDPHPCEAAHRDIGALVAGAL